MILSASTMDILLEFGVEYRNKNNIEVLDSYYKLNIYDFLLLWGCINYSTAKQDLQISGG